MEAGGDVYADVALTGLPYGTRKRIEVVRAPLGHFSGLRMGMGMKG